MSDEKDTEIMSPYEDYSVEELQNALRKVVFLSDLGEDDIKEIEQMMKALQKKAPLPQSRSVEDMWEDFQTIYAEDWANLGIQADEDTEEVVSSEQKSSKDLDNEVGKGPSVRPTRQRHRVLVRIGLVAAMLVLLLGAVTATACALGFNLWGWIPVWGNEDMRFVSETPKTEVAHDIPAVLREMGIEEPLYPTWLPEYLSKTEAVLSSEPLFLYEAFHCDNTYFSISISPSDGSEATVYQKNANPPKEYIVGNTVHYIFENFGELTSVWNTEDYTVVLIGNISIEELTRIIDSIYEVS